jgi:hypothetical protein
MPQIAPPDFGGYPARLATSQCRRLGGRAESDSDKRQLDRRAIRRRVAVRPDRRRHSRTIVSVYDPLGEVYGPVPSGLLLVTATVDRAAPLLHRDAGPPMPVARMTDLIGAGRGGEIATIHSECSAHTCFDTLDVLGWDGAGFVNLMGDRLQMPHPTSPSSIWTAIRRSRSSCERADCVGRRRTAGFDHGDLGLERLAVCQIAESVSPPETRPRRPRRRRSIAKRRPRRSDELATIASSSMRR